MLDLYIHLDKSQMTRWWYPLPKSIIGFLTGEMDKIVEKSKIPVEEGGL
jgi:hypothetical protein